MRLPVGESDFREVITSRFEFVDKSLFIKDIIDDDPIVLITRPRRFGKTLNLSMLRYFFDSTLTQESTKPLFEKLAINDAGDEYARHQNQHPVISLSFKDVKAESFEEAYASICSLVKDAYRYHHYLIDSQTLLEADKAAYQSILRQDASIVEVKNALKNLILYLHEHHATKVVVLIDEYDTPIQSGYINSYYNQIVDFFRHFFGASLKDNSNIFKAVLTGILRVSKENLFSGLNNIVTYSILDSEYGCYFGFTEQEVEQLIQASQLDEVKFWYNGYKVGNHTLYNPWSIANYIKKHKLTMYWVNTSDNALIKNLLTDSNAEFKQELEILLQGGNIEHVVDGDFVLHDLNMRDESTLWTLLLLSGYLKVDGCQETDSGLKCRLSIPNKEVRKLYRKIIESWLSGSRSVVWYNKFLSHLLNGEMELFTQDLRHIMEYTVSIHDTGRDPEAFYHGLIIGLTASLQENSDYELRSNRESGSGRYDYFIISKDADKFSILMEFKKAQHDDLDNAAKSALQQIESKHYIAEAEQRGINKILKIGIAFNGKQFALKYL